MTASLTPPLTSPLASRLLIDPLATDDSQWLQKQQILTQLRDCANQPVTDLLNERHSLLEQFEQLIFEQPFDAIFGGMLIRQDRSGGRHTTYSKPVLTNLYLAEILLAADQVFYSGKFSFIANKILDNLLASISKTGGELVETTKHFLAPDLACSFDERNLTNLLDGNELALLNALIEGKKFNGKPHRLICYQKPLRMACDQINMHFKQAQVIEHGMMSKLIKSSGPSVACEIVDLDNILSINCAFVIMLCQLKLFSKREDITSTAKNLFNKTLEYIGETSFGQKPSDYRPLIDAAFTRIVLLQIDFGISFLDEINSQHSRINQCLFSLNNSIDIGKEQRYKINFINHFIEELEKEIGRKLIKITPGHTRKMNKHKKNFQLVFLDKNAPDLDRKIVDLHAKYDNRRFIFQVDYPLTSQLA